MPPGIATALLVSQVRNTVPFLFDETGGPPYADVLRAWAQRDEPEPPLNEFFKLCMSAHWATAGTFVPTDVDNAIRKKHWEQPESPQFLGEMADLVLESFGWDYAPYTARRITLPDDKLLATHEGTWFSVAAGAYAACKVPDPERAEKLLEAIASEVRREADALANLRKAEDALGFLKALPLVCHNLGDLDRVIDFWELPADDALRLRVYDATKPGAVEHDPLFAMAAEINTAHLAPENHRHLALRKAKGLRRKRDYLLPVGPFLDSWGVTIAQRVGGLDLPALGEVVSALLDGMEWEVSGEGYPRALAGILEAVPGGFNQLAKHIPGRDQRLLSTGALRQKISVPRARFEARWAKIARL
ncbi:hypothetical protein EPO15_12915 [bacterium]|nr:MAG: hypothetical protein EPO15_12915 [bacterium]